MTTPTTPAEPHASPPSRSRWVWVAVSVAVAAVALLKWMAPAPVPKTRTDGDALEKLAGLWEFESRTLGSRSLPVDNPNARLEIKDGYMVQLSNGHAEELELDPSTDPKRMTMTPARIRNGRPVTLADGHVQRAVYALEGDTLTIVVGYGADYPASLPPKPDDRVLVVVYKRVKN